MQSLRELLTDHIREDEVPPRDEGPDLPHRHVAVEVGGARFGNSRAEFGVAQAGQHGGQSGDQEAEDDSGPRLIPGHFPGQNVDPGSEGGAHSQGDEVQGGQAPSKLRLFPRTVQCPATQQGFAEFGQLAGHVFCECVGAEPGAVFQLLGEWVCD